MNDFVFVDKARGFYATKAGALYTCEPNTFVLLSAPLALPTPFRILAGKEYDPFVIAFSEDGYVQVYNSSTMKWCIQTALPGNAGVIDSIEIGQGGESLTMKTSRRIFFWDGNGWTVTNESIESAPDRKVFAQCGELENEVAAAVLAEDVDAYEQGLTRYMLYIARYGTPESLIASWYEMRGQAVPFERSVVDEIWVRVFELVVSIDRAALLREELELSLKSLIS